MRVLFSVIAFRRVLLYDNAYGITLFARLQAGTAKSPQNLFLSAGGFCFFLLLPEAGPPFFCFSVFTRFAFRAAPAAITPNFQTPVFKSSKFDKRKIHRNLIKQCVRKPQFLWKTR
jgi:hypothetical protein